MPSADHGLAVKESGTHGAPTLVFLHGGGVGGWMWQPITAFLDEFHCLAPDMPEQGESLHIAPFSIQSAADQIAALIEARATNGKAHLIGLSLGGQVVVDLLARHTDKIERAIVSSALARPVPGASMYTEGFIRASYRWFVQPFKKMGWFTRLNMRSNAAIPNEYYEHFKRDYERGTAESFAHIFSENLKFRPSEALKQVHVPTLLVVGAKEASLMRQSAKDLAALLPNSKAVQHSFGVTRAEAHNWSFQAPQVFAEMVRAWVTDSPLPSALKPL
ncbi:MAG: alpha/beta hydrolase [Anaerolineae bacterium]